MVFIANVIWSKFHLLIAIESVLYIKMSASPQYTICYKLYGQEKLADRVTSQAAGCLLSMGHNTAMKYYLVMWTNHSTNP